MIKASFTHQKETGIIALEVKGHAGQAEKGQDIVCSAASILSYTIAQYLKYVEKRRGLKKQPRIVFKDGGALIVAKPTKDYEAEVLNAFFVAEVGYSLLAQNYPQYVELKMFGEAD
jgi:uncharacterized protein YsxB (DUF464 family)